MVDLFAEHGFLQQHVDAHQLRVNGLEKAKLSVLNLTGHLVAGGRTKSLSPTSSREWKYANNFVLFFTCLEALLRYL